MSDPKTNKTVFINTLGCPKNEVDSDILAAHLIGAGWSLVCTPDDAAAEVINTCGFITSAKEESIEAIFDAVFRRKRVGGRVVITGCLAQRYGEELHDQIPQADAIIGVHRPDLVVRALSNDLESNGRKVFCTDHIDPVTTECNKGRTIPTSVYGYVKISDGCDNRCGYCIIPHVRGGLRSRPMEDIEKEVRCFVDAGVQEIILVGQDTAAYGMETGQQKLAELITRLDHVPGDFWLRLLYMHPLHLSDQIIDAVANGEKTVPYFDMPLQHIADPVLSVMKRKVDRKRIENRLHRVRSRIDESVIRTTFLVGHPGETKECFDELVTFVQDFEFDRFGVFAYSPEKGTEVFDRTDAPPPEETDRRVDHLTSIQDAIVARKAQNYVGREMTCLLEMPSDIHDGMWEGRTRGDAPEVDGTVFVTTNGRKEAGFCSVTVEQADGYDLFGHAN